MKITDAMTIFNKKFPNRKVIGYWTKPNGYVLNTENEFSNIVEPGQFLVTNDGHVYGTNPIVSDLDPSAMRRL